MDSPRPPEPLSPAGYLRGLHVTFEAWTTTNLDRDPDDPYDPEADSPFTVFQSVRLTDA